LELLITVLPVANGTYAEKLLPHIVWERIKRKIRTAPEIRENKRKTGKIPDKSRENLYIPVEKLCKLWYNIISMCKRRKNMLIGLCGRSGSGKGYIAAMFAKRGIPSIDTDRVYRDLTGPSDVLSPCMEDLKERFGAAVVSADGSLNRAVMRSYVFGPGNAESLADLNRITHAHILRRTMEEAAALREQGADIILIDAPLLYESGFDKKCRAVICVTAPEEKLIARIMKRDGIGREDAEKRLRTQKSAAELADKADFVIENDAEKDILQDRVDRIITALRSLQPAAEISEKQ